MRRIIFVLSILLFIGCNTLEKDTPLKVSLIDNWEFKGIDTLDWKTADVPGNVFTDLLSHKIIEDPFIKNNEEKVQWVSSKNWEYKTTFTLSEAILKKEHIELNFEGLDTYAKIYINGNYQLDTDNAFRKYSISLKEIPIKKSNELRIVFQNTKSFENQAKQNSKYKLPEGNRIYTRKAQFQYGWDWGPKLNTSGIWKDVSINAWDALKFENIYIKQREINKKKAILSIEISIKSPTDKNVNLFTQINREIISSNISLKKGKHTYKVPIEIINPKLWWTHNLGKPYLYNFNFQLISDGKIKDEKSIKKGIRTIKLITKKDSIGESFYFELNGKPVYTKGANYIPQNSFQNKVTNQQYEKLLSDVVDSNMNMLRVWGGGIYENDIFYNLCDAKGILIWQDFMFACAMYPGDQDFLENVQEEATQNVKRLRNHASIALWCGNNENAEGWNRWGWQADRSEHEKEEIWSYYLKVFDSILPNTVDKLTDTDYWESSPKYGRGNPKYKFEGDAHDWWIWHDAYPFEHLEENVPRFMSEFGFQSFPSYEAIKYINQSDLIDISANSFQSHQKHSRGFQLIREYMERDFSVPEKAEDYVYMSQLLQAYGITKGIEAQRRAKPYNMGTLYWQLNDCWPVVSWSSIDFFGKWKALHYKAKHSFEDVLVSSKVENNILRTYVINDDFESHSGELSVKILDFEGNPLYQFSKSIILESNASQLQHQVNLEAFKLDASKVVVVSNFNNSQSLYYLVKPKALKLKQGDIEQKITKTDIGFSIELSSKTLQKDVFLYSDEKGHFLDNYFDLLPNETKIVVFQTKSKTIERFNIKTFNTFIR